MSRLFWQTMTVLVPDESLKEAIVGEFSGDGIAGVWERAHDSQLSEVVVYFKEGGVPPLAGPRVRRIFERNGYPPPDVAFDQEENLDWTLEWRKGFTSFPVGERFRVVPGWEEPPPSDSRIALRIDPGMAFGTGTHETTRTVIELLEAQDLRFPVLDLGTGAGILAIAACKLGANSVVACDLDADAVAVAQKNILRNRVATRLFVGSIDAIRAASIGLVLANLTSEVIVRKLEEVVRVLSPAGCAVFSGVLLSQALAVEERFRGAGLTVTSRVECDEWVSFLVSTRGC